MEKQMKPRNDDKETWLLNQIDQLIQVSRDLKNKGKRNQLVVYKLSYAYAVLEFYRKGVNKDHLARLNSYMWYRSRIVNESWGNTTYKLIEDISNKQVRAYCNRMATYVLTREQYETFTNNQARRCNHNESKT